MVARDPLSPCVKLCNFNPFTGVCEGCFRNMEEIGGWMSFSPEKKQAVLEELKERRADAEAKARGEDQAS